MFSRALRFRRQLPPNSVTPVRCSSTHSSTPSFAPPSAQAAVAATEPNLFASLPSSAERALSDLEVKSALETGKLKFFDLENQLGDYARAVRVRRSIVEQKCNSSMSALPFEHFDWSKVHGQCAENVIGYVPIPVGIAGPLVVDGVEYHVPLATTEGALIASTTRGCKAISMSGGARTEILNDGITRAPVLSVPNIQVAAQLKQYVDENFASIAQSFNSTSRFARLQSVKVFVSGRQVFLRFRATSGDAMGMNMVSKGVDKALEHICARFPSVEVLGLSGNVCTDKKPSAVNWIEGRGKSAVCEAIISGEVVRSVLKTTVDALVQLNYSKNLVGSAMAGSIGGFNAHAANIVTAAFLATGQDCAQNVESSNCMTLTERTNDGKDLYMSVTMPSLEVGTIGGGTILPGQGACLDLLHVRGSHPEQPGRNAQQLARIISATVMAGELSLMSALSVGHLIRSHLKLNRKAHPTPSATTVAPPSPQCTTHS